jgi:hypothetical protein
MKAIEPILANSAYDIVGGRDWKDVEKMNPEACDASSWMVDVTLTRLVAGPVSSVWSEL